VNVVNLLFRRDSFRVGPRPVDLKSGTELLRGSLYIRNVNYLKYRTNEIILKG
jgi:hypothetical protein